MDLYFSLLPEIQELQVEGLLDKVDALDGVVREVQQSEPLELAQGIGVHFRDVVVREVEQGEFSHLHGEGVGPQ